jgi:hypothetical protein
MGTMLDSHLRHQRAYGDLYDLLLWVQLFDQLFLINGPKADAACSYSNSSMQTKRVGPPFSPTNWK